MSKEQEQYEEKMRQAEQDLDFECELDFDEDDDHTPYWSCNSCNRHYDRKPLCSECDSCGSIVEENYY